MVLPPDGRDDNHDRPMRHRRMNATPCLPGTPLLFIWEMAVGWPVSVERGLSLVSQPPPSQTGFFCFHGRGGDSLCFGQPSHSMMVGVHMENANRRVNHGRSLQQPEHTVPAGDSFCTGLRLRTTIRTQWQERSNGQVASVPRNRAVWEACH
jgi:hypothetical protein